MQRREAKGGRALSELALTSLVVCSRTRRAPACRMAVRSPWKHSKPNSRSDREHVGRRRSRRDRALATAWASLSWRRTMADKTSFTPDEWARVVASPLLVGMAITAADPSGVWGLLKEGMAGGWALVEAKQNAQASPLVKAVAEGFSNSADAIRGAAAHPIAVQRREDARGEIKGDRRVAGRFRSPRPEGASGRRPLQGVASGGCSESRRGRQRGRVPRLRRRCGQRCRKGHACRDLRRLGIGGATRA